MPLTDQHSHAIKSVLIDNEDFFQDAIVKLTARELAGKVKFSNEEERAKYSNVVARNLRIDYQRSEADRKRRIKEHTNHNGDDERMAEINQSDQIVEKALKHLSSTSEKRRPNQKFTAAGNTIPVELIKWELEGLSQRQIACKVFGVASSTTAQTKKISNAMKFATERFANAVRELNLCT